MARVTKRAMLAGLGAAALAWPAMAQGNWPDRAIRVIVPFSPGGSNDVLARSLSERLTVLLGQSVVVENRAGAGGAIGADAVAKSAPDGNTLLFMSSSLTTNAAVQQLPYDPARDFTAIARVAVAPMIVVVGRDFPAQTMAELVRIARERPGRLRFGAAGPGDTSFFAAELLKLAGNLDMEAVSYRGITEAQTDAAAGRIELVVTTLASARSLIEGGQLRMLATATAERDPQTPSVPTARESSGVDYIAGVWWGMFGPANLPPAVTARLNAEINRALGEPGYRELLQRLGAAPAPDTQAAFAAEVRAELTRWREIAVRAGVARN